MMYVQILSLYAVRMYVYCRNTQFGDLPDLTVSRWQVVARKPIVQMSSMWISYSILPPLVHFITIHRTLAASMALASKVGHVFKTYPIVANSLTYGGMCVLAEFSQQFLTKRYLDRKEPPEPIDKASLGRYAVVGGCINSNMLYFWYRWLDKKFIGTAPKTIVKKLLLDQFVLTPHILTAFYISMSIMEGKEDIFAELKEKFVPTFQRSCLFWLPAQTINFIFIPPMARVVYVGTCSFIWVNILCYLKRANVSELTAKEEQPLSS